jgi:hypothetical protein
MTQPPGDRRQPPLAPAPQPPVQSQPPVPSVDGWGRPLTDFSPAANRAVLAQATSRLTTWLGVLLAALLLGGLLSALGLYFGGRAGLKAAATLGTGVAAPSQVGGMLADGLLVLAALLVLALTAIHLGVATWARELIGRLGRWAAQVPPQALPPPAADAVRMEALRRTLAGWLSFGQWGTVVGTVVSALVSLGLLLWTNRFTQQSVVAQDLGIMRTLNGMNTSLLVFQVVSGLLTSVPGVVITWLILGAVKRFMNLAVQRARGLTTGPLTQTARTVNSWFLMCLILLGLSALQLFVVMAAALVALPLLQDTMAQAVPEAWSSLLGTLPGLLTGVLLFSLLTVALYFALLILSRSYALSLARALDTPTTPPPAPLPTGWAGEHPNVFRGQL